MKKYSILISILLFFATAKAQISETIYLSAAGTLKDYAFTHPTATVTNLTISGNIDARDVRFMRDSMHALKDLDIDNTSIVAYTGTGGTRTMFNYYPANEMPEFSFYSYPIRDKSDTIITTIIFPQNLNAIGSFTFYECSGLTGEYPPTRLPW